METDLSNGYLIDLHYECSRLTGAKIAERQQELANCLPRVSLSAVGGFPFIRKDGCLTWCDAVATQERLRRNIAEALGVSAVLTFTNKNSKTLAQLNDICLSRKHLWGLHWITATLVFARHSLAVQMAFARDTRFYLSWVEETQLTGQVFAVTGNLKEWYRYLSHRDDKSFDPATRLAMSEAHRVLEVLF